MSPKRPRILTSGEIAAVRLAKLARWVMERDKASTGKLSRAARRLGVNQSYLTKILSGERTSVGLATVDAVVQAMPIRRDYFNAANLLPGGAADEPDPEDFVLESGADDPAAGVRVVTNARWQSASALAAAFVESARDGSPSASAARALAAAILSDPIVEAAEQIKNATDDEAIQVAHQIASLLSAPAPTGVAAPTLRVRAKPGALLPWPWSGAEGRPAAYIGLRLRGPDDAADAVVHRSGPLAYVSDGVVTVPDRPYFQRALKRGDLLPE